MVGYFLNRQYYTIYTIIKYTFCVSNACYTKRTSTALTKDMYKRSMIIMRNKDMVCHQSPLLKSDSTSTESWHQGASIMTTATPREINICGVLITILQLSPIIYEFYNVGEIRYNWTTRSRDVRANTQNCYRMLTLPSKPRMQ